MIHEKIQAHHFEAIEANPVTPALMKLVKEEMDKARAIRDDVKTPAEIATRMIAHIEGLRKLQYLYDSLKEHVLAGEQAEKTLAKQAGITDFEYEVSRQGELDGHNNRASIHAQLLAGGNGSGLNRKYLPG